MKHLGWILFVVMTFAWAIQHAAWQKQYESWLLMSTAFQNCTSSFETMQTNLKKENVLTIRNIGNGEWVTI